MQPFCFPHPASPINKMLGPFEYIGVVENYFNVTSYNSFLHYHNVYPDGRVIIWGEMQIHGQESRYLELEAASR